MLMGGGEGGWGIFHINSGGDYIWRNFEGQTTSAYVKEKFFVFVFLLTEINSNRLELVPQ